MWLGVDTVHLSCAVTGMPSRAYEIVMGRLMSSLISEIRNHVSGVLSASEILGHPEHGALKQIRQLQVLTACGVS
jgi:hypothetical protein